MTDRSGKGSDKKAKRNKKGRTKKAENATGKKSGKKSRSKKKSSAGKKTDRTLDVGSSVGFPLNVSTLLPPGRLLGSLGESTIVAPTFPLTTELIPVSGGSDGLIAEVPTGVTTPVRRRHRGLRTVVHLLSIVLIAGLIAFGLRLFVFQAFYVPSPSMVPTLAVHDRIVVYKLAFHPSGLRPGDIVVFTTPPAAREECVAPEGDLVKRVIATPGQVIWSIGNTVYVNGHRLAQPYLAPNTPLGRPIVRQKLGADDFFVMGDNRGISCDSRYWGPLNGSRIIGRVFVTIWHNGHPDLHFF